MERSLRKARKDTTSSSFFLRIRTAGGKDDEQRNLEGGGPDVPRLGGAWDHPVTLGSLSPRLGGGEKGGVRGRGPQTVLFCEIVSCFYDHLGFALQTKEREVLGVFVLPAPHIKTTKRTLGF